MEITEYFMGAKKCFSFKYNEEFDYERPGVFWFSNIRVINNLFLFRMEHQWQVHRDQGGPWHLQARQQEQGDGESVGADPVRHR